MLLNVMTPQRRAGMRRAALLTLSTGLILGAGCSSAPDALPSKGLVMPVPDKSVFLRASFDDDPSSFIGRFLPNNLEVHQIDENQAMKTRCSEFITFKEVRASGSYDEYYNSAREASLGVSVPGVANATAGAGANATVRVRYQLSKKMRAEVNDQAAFDQCCTAAADQCPDFIIGEFFYGTGEVFQAVGSSAGFDGEASDLTKNAEMSLKDEVAWKRQTTFEEVYFAFRKQRVRDNASLAANSDDCSWADNVPTSLDGQYFVGISAPTLSEADARDMAMRNARAQAVRYLGEYITSASATTSGAMEGYLQDEKVVTAVAEGLASRVKDQRWCPAAKSDTPKGTAYTVKVLAFFPKADEVAAAKEAVDKVEATLDGEGKLDGKAKDALKKTREALK